MLRLKTKEVIFQPKARVVKWAEPYKYGRARGLGALPEVP